LKVSVPGIKFKRDESKGNNQVIFICQKGPLFLITMEQDGRKMGKRRKEWATYRSLPVEFEGLYFCHVAYEDEEDRFSDEHENQKSDDEKSEDDESSGYQNKKWLKNEIESLLSKN